MSDAPGMTVLEQNIARLEQATADAREATREAHAALKDLRAERAAIDRLLSRQAKDMVDEALGALVKEHLDRIGPELVEHSHAIYERVGQQVDKLIDLSLGKEFALGRGREDIRPKLAAKLREWIREELDRA